MQNLKTTITNEIDISLLDNEFFVAILNQIIAYKKSEVQNGLSKN